MKIQQGRNKILMLALIALVVHAPIFSFNSSIAAAQEKPIELAGCGQIPDLPCGYIAMRCSVHQAQDEINTCTQDCLLRSLSAGSRKQFFHECYCQCLSGQLESWSECSNENAWFIIQITVVDMMCTR